MPFYLTRRFRAPLARSDAYFTLYHTPVFLSSIFYETLVSIFFPKRHAWIRCNGMHTSPGVPRLVALNFLFSNLLLTKFKKNIIIIIEIRKGIEKFRKIISKKVLTG